MTDVCAEGETLATDAREDEHGAAMATAVRMLKEKLHALQTTAEEKQQQIQVRKQQRTLLGRARDKFDHNVRASGFLSKTSINSKCT